MTAEQSQLAAVDAAIPVAEAETVVWTGRPRVTVVLPAAVVGLALVVAGLVGVLVVESLLALALVVAGVTIPAGRYLSNQRTQYVITDYALYRRTGVLSRAVSQARLVTVQNSSYAQSLPGRLFGYGTVEFEIAGGGRFAYRRIAAPQEVRALVGRRTEETDTLAGGSSGKQTLPGTVEQWEQIRNEIRAINRTLGSNRRT